MTTMQTTTTQNPLMAQMADLRTWDNANKTPQVTAQTTRRATNGELLAIVKNGRTEADRSRAAETLRRQMRPICAAAIARHGHHLTGAEIDDLSQEVFIRLLQNTTDADPSPAYISRIAVNLLIDQCRHILRRGQEKAAFSLDEVNADGMTYDVADPTQNTEETVMAQMEQTALKATLQQVLKPTESAILLRRAEGASHDEIATELGLQAANVRKQCERGMKRLRTLAEAGQFAAFSA
jgi:RNA polymerase sigma factor (sigma-70 family)